MKLARDGDIYFEIVFSNELNVLLALAARTALCTVSMHVYTLYIVQCTHFTFTLLILFSILSFRFSFFSYTFQIRSAIFFSLLSFSPMNDLWYLE